MHTSDQAAELYDELAKRIHAKDDDGVRRVFRELLAVGRSRQEIVGEAIRLVEAKPNSNGYTEFTAGKSHSAQPQRRSKSDQITGNQTSALGADSTGNDADQPLQANPTTPEIAGAEPKPDEAASWATLKRAGAGKLRQIVEREPERSPENEWNGAEPTQIRLIANDRIGFAAAAVLPKPESVALTADEAESGCELEARDGSEIAPDSLEGYRNTPSGNLQASRRLREMPLSAPERLAAKLELGGIPTPKAIQAIHQQADALATERSSFSQRRWRLTSTALGIIAGVIILAAAAGGSYALWTLHARKLEEISLAEINRAVTWFKKINMKGFSANSEAAKTLEGPAQTREASASSGADHTSTPQGDIVGANTQSPAETPDPSAAGSKVAGPTEAAAVREEQNTEATSTRPDLEAPNVPMQRLEVPAPGTKRPVASGDVPTSARENNTEPSQSPPREGAPSEVSPIVTSALVARGDQLLGALDIASARLFYRRAAEAGDPSGALRMGMTFDPDFLARAGIRGMQGNPDQAIPWYRRATALGSDKATALEQEIQDLAQQIRSVRRAANQAPDPQHAAVSHRRQSTRETNRTLSKRGALRADP